MGAECGFLVFYHDISLVVPSEVCLADDCAKAKLTTFR